jgi:hypothetical protein
VLTPSLKKGEVTPQKAVSKPPSNKQTRGIAGVSGTIKMLQEKDAKQKKE